MPRQVQLVLHVLLAVVSVAPCACNKTPPSPAPAAGPAQPSAAAPTPIPPADPGLELQEEDYAQARRQFHTTLLHKGPSPQQGPMPRPSMGVTEVEYSSGDLRLKAWVNPPPPGEGKRPAVLFLHGGWGFGVEDWEMCQPYRDAGYVVMTPVLRAENGQPGSFTMFYDEVDDVLAAAERLAQLPYVDADRVYLSGHSAGGTLTMLAAMASARFRAAASFSGSPDRIRFLKGGWRRDAPFDPEDLRELQMRSPVAYATSFKCPARLYHGSAEPFFRDDTRRTALLAKARGLDVEVVVVPGDHMTAVPGEMKLAIEFFRQRR